VRSVVPACALGLAVVALVVASAALDRPASPEPGQVVFRDGFDGENGFAAQAAYDGLRAWEVVEGSVDLVGTYPYTYLPPRQGLGVDLDGTTADAGTLRTRRALSLSPGRYRLTFRVAGTPRVSAPNHLTVSVGRWASRTLTVPAYAPVRAHALEFTVSAPDTARIVLTDHGRDNHGALVDDVELRRL
jgi:hypothetical protein